MLTVGYLEFPVSPDSTQQHITHTHCLYTLLNDHPPKNDTGGAYFGASHYFPCHSSKIKDKAPKSVDSPKYAENDPLKTIPGFGVKNPK